MHFASSNSSLPHSVSQQTTITAEDSFGDLDFYGGSVLQADLSHVEDADPEGWILGDSSSSSSTVYYNSAAAYHLRLPPQKSPWTKSSSMVLQNPSVDKVRPSSQPDRSFNAMACSSRSSSSCSTSTITTATDCSSRNSVSMSPSVSSSSTTTTIRSRRSSASPGDGLLSVANHHHRQELVSRFKQRVGTTARSETMEMTPPAVQPHRRLFHVDDPDHPTHLPTVLSASSHRRSNNDSDGVSRSSESRGVEDPSDHHRFHQRRRHRRIIGRHHQGSHDASDSAFLVERDRVLLCGCRNNYCPIDHSAESHLPADFDGGCRFPAVIDDSTVINADACRRADLYYGSFQRNISTSGRHCSVDWTEIIASHESSDSAAACVRQFLNHGAAADDIQQLERRGRSADTRYNVTAGDDPENGITRGNRVPQPVSASVVKYIRRQTKQSGDGFVTSSSSSSSNSNRQKLKQKNHAVNEARSLVIGQDECVSEILDPAGFEATQRRRSAEVSGRSIDYDLFLEQIGQGVKEKSGKSSRAHLMADYIRGGDGSSIRDYAGTDGVTESSVKQIESRYNLLTEKIRGGVTEASGSDNVCRICCREDMNSMASTMTESGDRIQLESYAISKCSEDPKQDFKQSMVEMIVEKELQGSYDLMELLQCYLTLNSDSYHNTIVRAFAEVWTEFIVHHHRNRDRDRANAAHSFRRSNWNLAAGESLPENHPSIDH